MPKDNRFRHQSYSDQPPTVPYHLMEVRQASYPSAELPEFEERMQRVGKTLRDHQVSHLFLVHGTFAGDDAFGAITHLERLFPDSTVLNNVNQVLTRLFPEVASLRELNKKWQDARRQDDGNYTGQYAETFQKAVGSDISIERFLWSSANNHVGRSQAAVQLLSTLLKLELDSGQRLLLWGHSHAGNVFALVTNLLANHQPTVEQFFDAGQIYFRDLPEWKEVQEILARGTSPNPLAQSLDIVTFGTPIRYGWDTAGLAKLLHFVNHRPADGLPPYRAPFPQQPHEMLEGRYGDIVQILGIAGTDFMPILTDKKWAERRLSELLESNLKKPSSGKVRFDFLSDEYAASLKGILALPGRLKAGDRVPEDGSTLLVNYADGKQRLGGHGVYTRLGWLLFQAEEVAKRFYSV